MEELLNHIRDYEIKEYMKEALLCYNSKSYKACIILSMSAAMYDLHNKIKSLAPIVRDCRELDDEISKIKDDLNPYEKTMIERCASNNIGILSSTEGVMLQNYRNYRNLCAHPSGHKSSPEEARSVFSGVIDILLSKPPLLGINHKNVLFEQLKETTFFPDNNLDTIKKIMKQKIEMIHPSARNQIAKFLITKIKESHNDDIIKTKQIENSKMFIAFMNEFCELDISSLIQILIEDDVCTYDLLDIIYINPKIVKCLNEIDINKIISKITISIEDSEDILDYVYKYEGEYLSYIINSILESSTIIPNCNTNNLLDCICKIRHYGIQTNIISNLLGYGISKSAKDYLCKSLISYFNVMDLMTFYKMVNEHINKILELLYGDEQLVSSIVNKINLLLKSGDFYYQNDGLNKLEFINYKYKKSIDDNLSVDLIINIINGSHAGSYNCRDIINGKIQYIELIIDTCINKIINCSESISYFLSSIVSYRELIKLLVNNKKEDDLYILIDKINKKELILDKESHWESVLKRLNNALDYMDIKERIILD